jgi:hypothetical protein
MKTKKLPKKTKTKKKGGNYVTTQFETYTPNQRAHMLYRGIEDFLNNGRNNWYSSFDPDTEALLTLNDNHIYLLRTHKKVDVRDMVGKMIKINITHMPKNPALPSASPVSNPDVTPRVTPRVTPAVNLQKKTYQAEFYEGEPYPYREQCRSGDDKTKVKCRITTKNGYTMRLDGKCNGKQNKCDARAVYADAYRPGAISAKSEQTMIDKEL